MAVARHDIELDEFPAAGIAGTDAIPGLVRGLAAGGALGMLAAVAMLSFEGLGFAFGGAAIPAFGVLGAAVSGLGGFFAGASIRSSRLKPFEHAIQHDGKILIMLGARKERGEELARLIKREIPEIDSVGFEPPAPLMP